MSSRGFLLIAALLFFGSAALTLSWGASMATMPGMEMPGGWTMSMAWMRMPGQSWSAAATAFLGMWDVMMLAMMLPVLAPTLWRYRQALSAQRSHADALTAVACAGYFAVWTGCGALAFPLGAALAAAEMQVPALARAVPVMTAGVIMIAGVLQLSRWKFRQLDCCAKSRGPTGPATVAAAWRCGIRIGIDCCRCCAPLTALLLVAGVMDLGVMAVVTAAICAERLAPRGRRLACITGLVMIAGGAIYLGALTMREINCCLVFAGPLR